MRRQVVFDHRQQVWRDAHLTSTGFRLRPGHHELTDPHHAPADTQHSTGQVDVGAA